MARTRKTEAQKAHEARNKALKKAADAIRREQKAASLAAFEHNLTSLKEVGKQNAEMRASAHAERNASAAKSAAARKAGRIAAHKARNAVAHAVANTANDNTISPMVA